MDSMVELRRRLAAVFGSNHDAPESGEWYKLAAVAEWVDCIIDDGPAAGDPSQGGLLRLTIVAAEPSGSSKLASMERGADSIFASVTAALPGVDSSGPNRAERLSTLRKRMPELAAYRWLLSRHVNYKAMVRRFPGLGGKYAEELAEFRLLAVVAPLLGNYFQCTAIGSGPTFPSAKKVKKAIKHAEELQKFYRESGALVMAEKLGWESGFSVDTMLNELRTLAYGYKSPQDQQKALQTMTLDKLAQALAKAFDRPSQVVLVDLAAIIGYSTDSPNVSKRIKELGLVAC